MIALGLVASNELAAQAIVFYDSRLSIHRFSFAHGVALRRSVATFVLVVLSAVMGCRGAGFAGAAKQQALVTPQISQQDSFALAAMEVPASEKPLEEALAEVQAELTAAGTLDAEEKRLLMGNLREAKRENWPLIVRQFQSALAYSEQLAVREEKAASETLTVEKTTTLVASKPTTGTSLDDSRLQAVPVSFVLQETPLQRIMPPTVTVVPEPPLVLSKPPQQITQQVTQPATQQVDFISTGQQSQPSHDWQVHLQSAIQNLEGSVQPTPGSTAEVNQHMRLRLLQLLAGNEESALQSIPGATAPQQDYWNKQLFAISTFLDGKRQPDDRRRAAGSLMHLDQARAKLSELATLEVRKLTFVDSVDGYGTYELHEETKFRPGDQVTLYAEIENFSSESTKEGYRTRLATSYEVVDKNGKRVDSAQFPEVEDVCQNPRRDFHMQYTVTLPTRIYPEQYEIRLIVTDQQSHKIGQASVPFEIFE